MTDDQSDSKSVRGVSLLSVSLHSEQVMDSGNVPTVRATTVNFGSK
jgi:hypothetical protein